MAEITQNRSGSWQVRVFKGRDAAGKKVRHTETFPTHAQATAYAAAKETEKARDTFVEPSQELLSTYIDRYLDLQGLEGIRQRTIHGYRAIVRRWILLDQKPGGRSKLKGARVSKSCPNLGCLPISKVKPDDVRRLYTYMVKVHGLSGREVRLLHAILNPALRRAEQEGCIGRNPCASVKPPKVVRKKVEVMTPEHMASFRQASKEDRLAALWALLLGTGLRPEEAYALSWSDFRDGHVHVERVLVGKTTEGGWHFAPPKTSNGTRSIPLPASVETALRQHRVRQAEEKLASGPRYEDLGLVFASVTGTPLQHRNVTRRHFDTTLKAAGLLKADGKPLYSPYVLRHSFATTMIYVGKVPVKTVSVWLGHSSVSFTLDVYCHAGADQMNEAAGVADRVMFGT